MTSSIHELQLVIPHHSCDPEPTVREPRLRLFREPFGVMKPDGTIAADHTFYFYSNKSETHMIPSHECMISRLNDRTIYIKWGDFEIKQDSYESDFVLIRMMRVR
jgi:hypothetical protein